MKILLVSINASYMHTNIAIRDLKNFADEHFKNKSSRFSENRLDKVKNHSPKFYKTLTGNGFESALIARIRKSEKISGYLVCAVKRSLRIWQENECAVLYYVAGLLEA